jgi:hypothetical protein
MDSEALALWAEAHAVGGEVDRKRDMALSLTSKLVRFRWNDGLVVGVGADAAGKVRINALLDGVAWFLATRQAADNTLHLVFGCSREPDAVGSTLKEQLGAIGTLTAELSSGPEIHTWLLSPSGPTEVTTAKPAFTSSTPQRWNQLLMSASAATVTGMAADLVEAINHPAFALYPKLSSQKGAEPWQMRLDGLEVGRIGASTATLRLASSNYDAPSEPRDTWRKVIGQQAMTFSPTTIDELVMRVGDLVGAWSAAGQPNAVLQHGQPEHALEMHVLSGRLPLNAGDTPLHPAVPLSSGVLAAAQFPTLWGDVTRPARYLDALLTDAGRRPWAVELKDQDAGGGHGAYLRHGVGQAVLYRHFIRSAAALDPWFTHHQLDRLQCRAALAFPVAAAAAAKTVHRLRDLASRYAVEVIEFSRPGGLT